MPDDSQAIVVAAVPTEAQDDVTRGLAAWPSESAEAWRAFQLYRDQKPPRRVLGVVGFPTSKLSAWAREFDWFGRVREYDVYMAAIVQREKEAVLRSAANEIAAEHLQVLKTARALVQRELDKLLAMSLETDTPISRIAEITKLAEMEIKYSRLLDDKSTENVAATMNLSALSLEELRQYRALQSKVT